MIRIPHFLAASTAILGLALACPAMAANGVTPTEIVIGQDIDLTGTISARMKTLIVAPDANN